MRLAELAERLDVPFKRIEWWVRQGYIRPENPNDGRGRGHYRRFPLSEAYVAQCVVHLQREYGIEASPTLFQRIRNEHSTHSG